jgi:hypothetical protein
MARSIPINRKDLSKQALQIPTYSKVPPAIVCIILLSILAGVSVVILASDTIFLGLGAMVLLALFIYKDQTVVLLSLVVFSAAVSSAFWLDHRILLGDFPLSIPDGIIALYGLYGVIMWLRKGASRVGNDGRVLLIIWFLYNSVWGLGLGLYSGNPVYAILQEYRLVLYTTIAYFTTLVIFRPERHLPVVMRNLIYAGLIVSIWQLAITISGHQMGTEEIVFLTPGGIGRTLRDVNVPLYFAGTALIFLVVVKMHAPLILKKTGSLVWIIGPIFLTPMLLSMTRTVWFCLGISIILLVLYIFAFQRSTGRLLRLLPQIVGLLFILFTIFVIVQKFLPSVYQAIGMTLDLTLFSEDSTRYERSEIMLGLIGYFYDSGQIWGGIGFGNMWSGATRMGVHYNLHNTYLAYLVIGGVPGLLLFLGVWIYPIIVYLRLLRRSPGVVVRAFAVASIMNWIMMSPLMLAMPPHWTESAFFGITLGIASVLGHSRPGSKYLENSMPEREALL